MSGRLACAQLAKSCSACFACRLPMIENPAKLFCRGLPVPHEEEVGCRVADRRMHAYDNAAAIFAKTFFRG